LFVDIDPGVVDDGDGDIDPVEKEVNDDDDDGGGGGGRCWITVVDGGGGGGGGESLSPICRDGGGGGGGARLWVFIIASCILFISFSSRRFSFSRFRSFSDCPMTDRFVCSFISLKRYNKKERVSNITTTFLLLLQ
jgi:hypothetical protein